jgi:hypothetical protein
MMIVRETALVILLGSALLAQSAPAKPQPEAAPQTSSPQGAAQSNDALTQMRDDLNKLESLNLNMSSEIEFLRDQNLQILLRTNSQMWTVLIRDLRRQIDREEQRRSVPPQTGDHGAAPKPDR